MTFHAASIPRVLGREGPMLILDGFSESVLFQCDRCRLVGQMFTDLLEEEGTVYCWNCLLDINRLDRQRASSKGPLCC